MCRPPPAGTLAGMNTRSPVIAVAAAGLALLTAACGSSPASTASTTAAGSSGEAFAQCMRSHGVPDYPAPQSNGQMQKITSGQQVGVSDSALASAQAACQSRWPYQALTPAQQQRQLTEYLKFARCMRSAGLPRFPDPTASQGQVVFVLSASQDGFNPHSPQVLAKARQCERVLPAGSGLPSVRETS